MSGFTLLELLAVVAILTLVMGAVFTAISSLQKVYKTQETKLDATQETRNLLDEIGRELHQSGFPGPNMFDPGVLPNPNWQTDQRVAVGIVNLTPTQLWFEGDVDNDGAVESVQYTLLNSAGGLASAGGTCPCTLQRSIVQKQNGTAPNAQPVVAVSTLANVINTGGALPIAGNTNGANNDILFASYKNPAVFQQVGKTIIVTLNVLTANMDQQNLTRPALSMTVTAKLNN
ncbi:MAG TPA: prepilin-type N-terminal cleavage/methylation domain-containing protein [Terriglobales bacterium]|nr:prepilin-type N-terminal cleavage/methylation domain-containing protein [Terriglobales bacterium]